MNWFIFPKRISASCTSLGIPEGVTSLQLLYLCVTLSCFHLLICCSQSVMTCFPPRKDLCNHNMRIMTLSMVSFLSVMTQDCTIFWCSRNYLSEVCVHISPSSTQCSKAPSTLGTKTTFFSWAISPYCSLLYNRVLVHIIVIDLLYIFLQASILPSQGISLCFLSAISSFNKQFSSAASRCMQGLKMYNQRRGKGLRVI